MGDMGVDVGTGFDWWGLILALHGLALALSDRLFFDIVENSLENR